MNGPVPAAVTLRFANWPDMIELPTGCVEIDGGVQLVWLTVIVATALSIWPQELKTRTQYVVVVVGEGLYVAALLFGPGATGRRLRMRWRGVKSEG